MTRRKPSGLPRPTWTSLTVEALARADDFLGLPEIMAKTKGSSNQITAALHSLKQYHVVDSVESGGRLFWFLTGQDDRQFTRKERCEECEPRHRGGQPFDRPATPKASTEKRLNKLRAEIREANEIAARLRITK